MATKIGNSQISNSARSVRFEIRKNDIINGQPNDPCACAAARALKRTFDAKEVFVYRNVTYVVDRNGRAMRYQTSAPLRMETIVFDRNGEFYPGEYDIYAMPEPIEATRKSSTSPKRGKRNVHQGVRHAIPNVRPTASQKLPRV